ncbi:MAG: GcrA family cell cycle regulator [Sphingomonadales bacterium]
MSWTDERIQRLKDLWEKGLSASQIAADLAEGVTRNAVIGKAHRMGLSSRPSPVKAEPAAKPRKPAAPRPKKKEVKKAISLLDLNERMCKWPIGHPGDADFHFCGKSSVSGMPYCDEHCAMAYQAQNTRRDRRPPRPKIM